MAQDELSVFVVCQVVVLHAPSAAAIVSELSVEVVTTILRVCGYVLIIIIIMILFL